MCDEIKVCKITDNFAKNSYIPKDIFYLCQVFEKKQKGYRSCLTNSLIKINL